MRSSIWIADDDEDDRDFVLDALADLGNTRQVYTFLNGEHAREAFLSPHIPNPKYLIVDSRMPKLGGIDLVRFLLEHKLMSRLHILLWSGAYSPMERHFCTTHQLICRQKPASFHLTVKLLDEVFTKLTSNHLSVKSPINRLLKK